MAVLNYWPAPVMRLTLRSHKVNLNFIACLVLQQILHCDVGELGQRQRVSRHSALLRQMTHVWTQVHAARAHVVCIHNITFPSHTLVSEFWTAKTNHSRRCKNVLYVLYKFLSHFSFKNFCERFFFIFFCYKNVRKTCNSSSIFILIFSMMTAMFLLHRPTSKQTDHWWYSTLTNHFHDKLGISSVAGKLQMHTYCMQPASAFSALTLLARHQRKHRARKN